MTLLRKYSWLGIVLAVAGGLVYWRYAPVEAQVHTVKKGTLVAEVFGTGTLEAKTHAILGVQIYGRIMNIPVEQGKRIKKGQVLANLESEELQWQLEMAQANLDAAKAAVERLKAERQSAETVFNQARRDYDRARSLHQSKVQSESETEKSAERLSVAQSSLRRAHGAVAEAKAQVVAAEKTLLYHNARLDDAKVTAPFDGLVILRHRDPGDIVVPGSAICEVVATDVLWVSAWVDESQMEALKPGQTARVVFRSNPEIKFEGTVERLGRQVDRETREFIVDVRVLDLPANWAIGQRAEVYIATHRRENVHILPQRLLSHRNKNTGLWVVRDGKSFWQKVETGLSGNDMVEITKGLSEGDSVIVTGQGDVLNLRNGQRIEAK